MTDHEYAGKIYNLIFYVTSDNGDAYTRGILDALMSLSIREQTALECYYRYGNTYEQAGRIIGDIKGEAARRMINKALMKLRHPSKSRNYSVKLILDERDKRIDSLKKEVDGLYDQIERLTKGLPLDREIQFKIDERKAGIGSLGFSSRINNHLLDAGINTVESLIAIDSFDVLMEKRNFGKKSRLEIIQKMRQLGYNEWADKMDSD